MSAAGVVSIAFAKTGFVLLCRVPSELLSPGDDDPIEMRKRETGQAERFPGGALSERSAFRCSEAVGCEGLQRSTRFLCLIVWHSDGRRRPSHDHNPEKIDSGSPGTGVSVVFGLPPGHYTVCGDAKPQDQKPQP
jgi:hypothetical protein